MFEDKTLVCKECGKEFVFTAGEQEFYAEKGFENEPQRCKECRQARKNGARAPRQMYTATCAACGKEAKVPFQPRCYLGSFRNRKELLWPIGKTKKAES